MLILIERFLVPRPIPPRADIGIIVPQTKRYKMALQPRLDPSCHQTVIDVQLETVSIEEQGQLIDVRKKKKVSFSQDMELCEVSTENPKVPTGNSEVPTDLLKVPTDNPEVPTDLLKVSTENSNPRRAESSDSQKACRFCFEPDGDLISPCKCSGSQSFVHIGCMREWMEKSTQVNCGICQSPIQGFKSRKHALYYSAEVVIVMQLFFLTLVYFGSNLFLRNCHNTFSNTHCPPFLSDTHCPPFQSDTHCPPFLVSAAIVVHLSSPILLFLAFWSSTLLVRFKVIVTVYDTDGDGSSDRQTTHPRPSGGMNGLIS